jgi:hypothetical protein
METAATSPLPIVAKLTKEQRNALLVDLIKAHFAEFGGPWFLTAWDGDTLLGVFHPESLGPKQTTLPDFPPEFIEEMKRRNKEIMSGRAELLTSEEAQDFMMKELDRMHAEEVDLAQKPSNLNR